jgi:hypothetical protein
VEIASPAFAGAGSLHSSQWQIIGDFVSIFKLL